MNLIELSNVSIDYPLYYADNFSIKSMLFNAVPFLKNKIPPPPIFRALDQISLCIKAGERVGIIGLNGAGKTTLLRTMAGIFTPTTGTVKKSGKISTLLDLATGIEVHNTGFENIKIRLMFLGEDKDSIDEKIPEIAEFTGLGEFLHQPVSTYSTGMFTRLAFAVSTSISPEILIADEVFGAGDAQFAINAQKRIEQLLEKNNTTVFSSHSMALIRQFCDRVIWLHQGKIRMDDAANLVIHEYEHWILNQ